MSRVNTHTRRLSSWAAPFSDSSRSFSGCTYHTWILWGPYVPWSRKSRVLLGINETSHLKNDGIPESLISWGPINPNPDLGWWVYPLLYGNNGSLDPGTYKSSHPGCFHPPTPAHPTNHEPSVGDRKLSCGPTPEKLQGCWAGPGLLVSWTWEDLIKFCG